MTRKKTGKEYERKNEKKKKKERKINKIRKNESKKEGRKEGKKKGAEGEFEYLICMVLGAFLYLSKKGRQEERRKEGRKKEGKKLKENLNFLPAWYLVYDHNFRAVSCPRDHLLK